VINFSVNSQFKQGINVMIKKQSIVMSALLICTLSLGVVCAEGTTTTLATVNDKAITQQDFENYVITHPAPPGINVPPNKKFVLEELVKREIVVQDALRQNFDKDTDFVERLADVRYNMLFEWAIQKYLEAHPVTDEQLRAEYQKFPPLKQYKLRHIVVASMQEGKSVINQVQLGANFATLAMQISMDPMSRQQGGELGWLTPEQMFPAITAIVAGLEKGKIYPDPVQSPIGWHVVLLEETRDVSPVSFETAKANLLPTVRAKQTLEYIEELRKKAEIELAD